MNSGFTFIDSIQGTGVFVNNGNGNGSFGNPQFNTLYYLSPAADQAASWGMFNCRTATLETGIPIVYLQSLTANFSYNNNTCTVTFSATGGMNAFSGMPYSYTITNPLDNRILTSLGTTNTANAEANLTFDGTTLTVVGNIVAQTLNVQEVTSSREFITGSSVNGSLLTNTHQFTGSVSITGSYPFVSKNSLCE
jgi:hypothetical protein